MAAKYLARQVCFHFPVLHFHRSRVTRQNRMRDDEEKRVEAAADGTQHKSMWPNAMMPSIIAGMKGDCSDSSQSAKRRQDEGRAVTAAT